MIAPQLIVLDLMDTLIVDPFFRYLLPLYKKPMNEIWAAIDQTVWPRFEEGAISEEVFFKTYYHPHIDPQAEGFPSATLVRQTIFDNLFFIEGMDSLLVELEAADTRLWVLSNYPIWFEEIKKRLALDRFVEDYVVSYEVGARKPSSKIYEALCQRAGVKPEQCYFVDDRQKNIEGARAFGMQAKQFESADTLRQDLIAVSVLKP
jgi:HAD superfamily hydrolase (TIGR01509 family)